MIRMPAVAGRFYPANPAELTDTLRSFIQQVPNPTKAVGIVVPHAGYMYSGHVAGSVYSRIEMPARTIVLCPNHTGYGPELSIMRSGTWETPLGRLDVDEALCDALIAANTFFEDDVLAHRFEHALEVQLPFIQHLRASEARFAPITVGTGSWKRLEEMGIAIGEVVNRLGSGILIIASSDMNHYETDAATRIKDRKAIDEILAMNPRGLFEVVKKENISMCGYGPAVAMLTAAKILGASKAQLAKYATSAEVSGDYDRVVGYAGIIVD